MMTANCATIAHSQVCERNSDQPSLRSRSMPELTSRSCASTRMLSSNGTVPSMPMPQADSAQPGPNTATLSPARAAPPIIAAFIASRLTALACSSRSAGTILGTSA